MEEKVVKIKMMNLHTTVLSNTECQLWIIDAAGVEARLIKLAKAVVDKDKSLQANSVAIRKIVPWKVLANALWRNAHT